MASDSVESNDWVIHSGATDHMTGSSQNFSCFVPCSDRDKVPIADGSLSFVSGKGSICCTPSPTLSSVPHVVETWRMIGYGKECDGVYILEPNLGPVSRSLSFGQALQSVE